MARPSTGWSEERLLAWIRSLGVEGNVAGPRGHDAAVLRAGRGRVVACVDQTIEGVHAPPGTHARRLGHKAAGRALSDLAATAARPRALLLAVSAPPDEREARLRAVVRAVRARGLAFGAELVGGDLAASPGPLALAVTALGELPARGTPPGRHRARPGQAVLLTGPVGGSPLGRHLDVEPRIRAGRWLHARGATALMDVSDGLARDLARLAATAGVRIDLERVPVHRDARRLAQRSGRAALDHALHDGEDHELVATLPAARVASVLASARRSAPGLAVVGRVRRGRGLYVPDPATGTLVRWSGRGGWTHGG